MIQSTARDILDRADRKKPIKRKRSKKPRRGAVKDPAYLEFIAGHRCCVCISWETPQQTPTEVAHVGARGLGQKCDDRQTLPVCEKHHRTGRLALHVLGKAFWTHHDLDREKLIKEYQEKYEQCMGCDAVEAAG